MRKGTAIFSVMVIMFAGCKTKLMKSTPFYEGDDCVYSGNPEDRVNLWPVAYWREPVGSVLWPIASFTDEHFAVRPIYSHYQNEHNFLWPLGRYDSMSGDMRFIPLFWYTGKNGDVGTPILSRKTRSDCVEWEWCTCLLGHATGKVSKLWVLPLVKWRCDSRLAEMERMMNANVLDGSIVGKVKPEKDGKKSVTNNVFRTESTYTSKSINFASFGLLNYFGRTRGIYCHGGDNGKYYGKWLRDDIKKIAGEDWHEGCERTVAFTERSEFGNDLLFGGEATRVVNFDYDSKTKVFDGEISSNKSLFGLMWSSRHEKIADVRECSKCSFLWLLWRCEDRDGDVSLDIFPGITYDTKKDGYMKMSFLWRFFRYENVPDGKTSVDLFFLPVWTY